MKRIAIFCDGTWNTPDEMDNGKGTPTNVAKMAKALSETSLDEDAQHNKIRQLLYYDVGIGAEGGALSQWFDGATGTGISENIKQAYWFLCMNYEPGDELYFIGFSRGAYTVRSLAGLIRNSGILKVQYAGFIKRAYDLYKSRRFVANPKTEESLLFRKIYAVEDLTKIKFIGVFDTVGSLGNPLFLKGIASESNQFHDTGLSSSVSNAFHALAIDERRRNFQAALWQQKPEDAKNVLEQMWFAGVHSDVGGGYAETGLSDIPLQWMIEKAEGCNLHFNNIRLNPDQMAKRHESMTWYYRLTGSFSRPIGKPQPDGLQTRESVHPSVMFRYENDKSYRPANLVRFLNRETVKCEM